MKREQLIKAAVVAGIFLLFGVVSGGCGESEEKMGKKKKKKSVAKTSVAKKDKDKGTGQIAVLETNKGVIKFKFYPKDAPETVKNFIKLAKKGYYDGLTFHRVVPGFVIQGGCPEGTGTGGPGYNIKAEFNDQKHLEGSVAMARAMDPDSAGSQFYICLDDQPRLDGQYTVFGQVTEGLEVVHEIGVGDVMKKVYIE